MTEASTIGGAYAYFCDEMNLQRIYATAEQHIANLDKMAAAVAAERKKHLDAIAKRDLARPLNPNA